MKKNSIIASYTVLYFVLILSIGITGMIFIAEIPGFKNTGRNSFTAERLNSGIQRLQVDIAKDTINSKKVITFKITDKDLAASIKKYSGGAPSCINCHKSGKAAGK